MKRFLLAIAAVLAIGSVSACADMASGGGGSDATPPHTAADSGLPPTLNDSFHYPSSD